MQARHGRRTVLGVAAAGALVAGGAAGAPASAGPLPAAGDGRLQAWSAQHTAALLGSRLVPSQERDRLAARPTSPGLSSRTTVEQGEGSSAVFPGGDLDRDGAADVLETRDVTDAQGRTTFLVVARAGRTGRVLWTHRSPVGDGHAFVAVPLQVGSPARAGVLLLDSGAAEDATGVVVTDRLIALAGPDGRTLWSHGDRGRVTETPTGITGAHVPQLTSVLRDAAGGDDLLLAVADFTRTVSADEDTDQAGPSSTDVYVVKGADGRAVRAGARVSGSAGVPLPVGVHDLTGDTADDIAVSVPGPDGAVETRDAVDGRVLWRTALPLEEDSPAQSVGVLTGSGAAGRAVEDLAVVVAAPAPASAVPTPAASPSDSASPSPSASPTASDPLGLPPLGLPGAPASPSASPSPSSAPASATPTATTSTGPTTSLRLLRGDTGEVALAVPGDAPVRLLRAGSPLVPVLGTSTSTTTRTGSTTTTVLHLRAVRTDGTVLYDRERSLELPGRASGFGEAYSVDADLQPDGALDPVLQLFLTSGTATRTSMAVVDGATGVPVAAAPVGLLLGSVTGKGDDLGRATLADTGHTLDVRLVRGRDRAALSRTLLRPKAALQSTVLGALDPRAGHSDVLVAGTGGRTAYLAVVDASGRLRWSDEHALTSLTAAAPRR